MVSWGGDIPAGRVPPVISLKFELGMMENNSLWPEIFFCRSLNNFISIRTFHLKKKTL